MCLGQGADSHMAQLMPLPLTISCSSKSRLVLPSSFYLSGAGSPGQSRTKSKTAIKRLCVCVCVCVWRCSNDLPALNSFKPAVGQLKMIQCKIKQPTVFPQLFYVSDNRSSKSIKLSTIWTKSFNPFTLSCTVSVTAVHKFKLTTGKLLSFYHIINALTLFTGCQGT